MCRYALTFIVRWQTFPRCGLLDVFASLYEYGSYIHLAARLFSSLGHVVQHGSSLRCHLEGQAQRNGIS